MAGKRVVLYVSPDAGSSRAAFVVSRKVGGAVARNRARRILRAAWRELRPTVNEGIDVVFVVRETAQGAKATDLEIEMRNLLDRMKVLRP